MINVQTITITTLNVDAVESQLCEAALKLAGTLSGAASLLGIRRDALRRRIRKHGIAWTIPPPRSTRPA